jgi:hypothetical protein
MGMSHCRPKSWRSRTLVSARIACGSSQSSVAEGRTRDGGAMRSDARVMGLRARVGHLPTFGLLLVQKVCAGKGGKARATSSLYTINSLYTILWLWHEDLQGAEVLGIQLRQGREVGRVTVILAALVHLRPSNRLIDPRPDASCRPQVRASTPPTHTYPFCLPRLECCLTSWTHGPPRSSSCCFLIECTRQSSRRNVGGFLGGAIGVGELTSNLRSSQAQLVDPFGHLQRAHHGDPVVLGDQRRSQATQSILG